MVAFDTWYTAQTEPMRIAVIGAVVAVWGTITASVIAMIVAWVQAKMAKQAIRTQERTLFLNLIDRRARWFDDTMQTWSDWISEQEIFIESIIRNEQPDTRKSLTRIAASRREAKWLFGAEVIAHLDTMEKSVQNYSQKRMRMRESGVMQPEQRPAPEMKLRIEQFSSSLLQTMAQQALLANIVSPYLNVSDIKAAVPVVANV